MNPFDIRKLQSHHNVLVVGKKGSGKSTLIQDIMYNLKDEFDSCFAILGNNQNELEYMPLSHVYQLPYDTFILKPGSVADHRLEYNTTRPGSSALGVVIDDCLIPDGYSSHSVKDLLTNGRTRNTFCIHSIQNFSYIPKDMMRQVDYVFMLGNAGDCPHLPGIPTIRAGGYSATVIDCSKHTDTPQEYKAKYDIPPFMLGVV